MKFIKQNLKWILFITGILGIVFVSQLFQPPQIPTPPIVTIDPKTDINIGGDIIDEIPPIDSPIDTPIVEKQTEQPLYVATAISFPTFIEVNGEKISFPYTDNNYNENVIIRTDKSNYGGWAFFDVYASVENKSGDNDAGNLYGYFKGSELESIKKLAKNVAYQVSVDDYGKKDTICATDLVATTTQLESDNLYQCGEKIQSCDIVNGKICTQNNTIIGSHSETRYRDEWQDQTLTAKPISYDYKKIVPYDYGASKKASDILLKDSVNYYKIRIKVTPKTQGEVFLEWKGLKTYGSLK